MPTSPSTLLNVENVDVYYGSGSHRKQVIQDATFSVAAGEAVGIIGETGSGKTTLARAVLGLVKPAAGRIAIDGHNVSNFAQRDWTRFRRTGVVQYVFQDPLRSLDPNVTIGGSLAEPLLIRNELGRADIKRRLAGYLDKVNLDPSVINRFPGELSGGQRQRVAVARALVTEPKLLILDEPVSALDSANRVQVLEILNGLRRSGVSLVFISHDLGSVAGITDRIMVLYQGRIVEINNTPAVINDPRHPYTRLLVGSAPTLANGAIDKTRRAELRALLGSH